MVCAPRTTANKSCLANTKTYNLTFSFLKSSKPTQWQPSIIISIFHEKRFFLMHSRNPLLRIKAFPNYQIRGRYAFIGVAVNFLVFTVSATAMRSSASKTDGQIAMSKKFSLFLIRHGETVANANGILVRYSLYAY